MEAPSNKKPHTSAPPAYGDESNWENKVPDILKPFQPAATSSFLKSAHYYPRGPNKTRPSISTIDDIPPPKHTPDCLTTLRYAAPDSLHKVCKESMELIQHRPDVSVAWRDPVPNIHHLLEYAASAILSRHESVDNTTAVDAATLWQRNVYLLNYKKDDLTSPRVLWAIYLGESMFRPRIDKHITSPDNARIGLSASSWDYRHLIDLSCVPLFGLELSSIIPYNYNKYMGDVISRISECYIVRRILREIAMPTAEELYEFGSGTHMSWYLLSPWSSFFIGLRDLLSRGKTEVVRPRVTDSLNISKTESEDKLENMSEQLLHRFMEVILILFSILCKGRDHYRSTPGRVDSEIQVGSKKCTILDDGYVYMSRGGAKTDRSRYGEVPILRYEAKRLKEASGRANVTAQIFSELLSAAIENMNFFAKTDPRAPATQNRVLNETNFDITFGGERNASLAPYHDVSDLVSVP